MGAHPDRAEIQRSLDTLSRVPSIELQRFGWHFQRNDFYSPLNDCDFLASNEDLWKNPGLPTAIDWNVSTQLETARVVARHVEELRGVPDRHSPGQIEYCWQNDFWNNADALVQYGLLRATQPRRIVEIGCGWSSLLMERALRRNATPCEVVQIEPHPNREIFATLPRAWKHYECILQRAPLDLFENLGAGDVCFYDGSHCSKTGSDVNWFFFEALPRLAPGVLVHIHDIFLPDPYPDEWIFERGQTWNEQFLVQAFLMHNHAYEIVIANRLLWRLHAKELDELYRGVQPSWGCSLWLRKVGPPLRREIRIASAPELALDPPRRALFNPRSPAPNARHPSSRHAWRDGVGIAAGARRGRTLRDRPRAKATPPRSDPA